MKGTWINHTAAIIKMGPGHGGEAVEMRQPYMNASLNGSCRCTGSTDAAVMIAYPQFECNRLFAGIRNLRNDGGLVMCDLQVKSADYSEP